MKKVYNLLFLITLISLINFSILAQDFFAEWDINKDGKITIEEFPGGKDNIEYFKEIDTNNDGIIDRRELNIFLGIPVENTPKHKSKPVTISSDDEIKKLKNELKSLNNELKKIKNENKGLKLKIKKLKNINTTLKLEINRLKKELAKLKLKMKLRNPNIIKLQNENERLKLELAKFKNQNKILLTEIKKAKQNNFILIKPKKKKVYNVVDIIKKTIPKPSKAQDLLMAEEAARLNAMRSLAERIRGSWIAACSKNIDAQNKLLIVGKLDPTKLVGVEFGQPDYNFIDGIVTVPAKISRPNIIESIRRTNKNLSPEDYQELRYMFPESISTKGYGAWKKKGQQKLMALYGAQLDARRRLIEQLRGVMVKSSSRMENFVLKKHEVVVSIETTLLIGVKVVEEKFIGNSIAQVTIEITRPMFIYSIRKGLEANGLKMTPEEYQNLRNMLNKKVYRFIGKAAVK